jgi:hypothetical protein
MIGRVHGVALTGVDLSQWSWLPVGHWELKRVRRRAKHRRTVHMRHSIWYLTITHLFHVRPCSRTCVLLLPLALVGRTDVDFSWSSRVCVR